MSKSLHIHIHRARTADAFEEGKHPRADDGKFGNGGGGKSSKPVTQTPEHHAKRVEAAEAEVRQWEAQHKAAKGYTQLSDAKAKLNDAIARLNHIKKSPSNASVKGSAGAEGEKKAPDSSAHKDAAEQHITKLKSLPRGTVVQTGAGPAKLQRVNSAGQAEVIVIGTGQEMKYHASKVTVKGK